MRMCKGMKSGSERCSGASFEFLNVDVGELNGVVSDAQRDPAIHWRLAVLRGDSFFGNATAARQNRFVAGHRDRVSVPLAWFSAAVYADGADGAIGGCAFFGD